MKSMTARRTVVGLTVLCALLFSAFAAANASAKGTTAFTCSNSGSGAGFTEADCETASSTGPYHHIEFVAGTKTELHTTATTPFVLSGTPGGIEAVIEASGAETSGTIENEAGPPMKVLSEETVTFPSAVVTKPAGKGCLVKSGKVVTKPLTNESIIGETATTTGILFKPKEGTTFTEITLEGCSVSGLNKTFPVTGTAVGTPKGTTLEFTKGSTESLLKFGGNKASLVGTVTVSGKDVAKGDTSFTGLSLTTTAS